MPIIQKHRRSAITLGDNLEMRSWQSTNPLIPNHPVLLSTRTQGAKLLVGNHCGFTGSIIVATKEVVIGNRVILGANAVVMDTDFHPIDPDMRRQDILAAETAPVYIDDDVFVGMNAIILKGVRIGRGSVVGAGSVVTKDIPPLTLVAGNPARIIRSLKNNS